MRPAESLAIVLVGGLALQLASGAFAEQPVPESAGFHIVRPGDTLERIAAVYLGDHRRWPEIWPLNQEDVPDPHWIFPRQRLVIPLDIDRADGAATLSKTSRRVEGQMQPHPWDAALERDLLRQRDGLRTFEASSAQVDFDDGSRLVLSEQSLVFIGEAADDRRAAQPALIESDEGIEIVNGQGDLSGELSNATDDGIEITLGSARAVPRTDSNGQFSTRARREASGESRVMAYVGASTLSSGGVDVDLPEGTGSAIVEGEPPSPPEQLLPAPNTSSPASGGSFVGSFSWQPVADAASYTAEVCLDARCGKLVARIAGLDQPSWSPANLPLSTLYWRVNAVSSSGLDGFVSPSIEFSNLGEDPDQEPPTVVVEIVGRYLAPRFGINPHPILAPGASFRVDVDDAGSGLDQLQMTIDGFPISDEDLQGPWDPGEHELAILATDHAGNQHGPELIPFIVDPDPPRLSWGLRGMPLMGRIDHHQSATADSSRASRIGPSEWRSKQRRPGKRLSLEIASDDAQVLLRPARGKLEPSWLDLIVETDQEAWIHASDEVCREIRLRYELVSGAMGGTALRIDAEDCVGNTIRHDFHLTDGTLISVGPEG